MSDALSMLCKAHHRTFASSAVIWKDSLSWQDTWPVCQLQSRAEQNRYSMNRWLQANQQQLVFNRQQLVFNRQQLVIERLRILLVLWQLKQVPLALHYCVTVLICLPIVHPLYIPGAFLWSGWISETMPCAVFCRSHVLVFHITTPYCKQDHD